MGTIGSPDDYDVLDSGEFSIFTWLKCEEYFRIERTCFFILFTANLDTPEKNRSAIIRVRSLEEVQQFDEEYDAAPEEVRVQIGLGVNFSSIAEMQTYVLAVVTTTDNSDFYEI